MTFPSIFATGDASGVRPSDTQIVSGSFSPTVTLPDIKQHLRKDPNKTADDAELTAYLNTALAKITEICIPLGPATVQDTFDGNGATNLILSSFPVNAITSVTVYTSAGIASTLSEAGGATGLTDGYRKNLAAGTLNRIGIRAWPAGWGNIVVQYTVGPASTPPDVALAVKLTVQEWWEARRLAGNQRVPGGKNADPGDLPNPTFGIPEAAYELLENWLKPARVA